MDRARLEIVCRNVGGRLLIVELLFELVGPLRPERSIAEALQAAPSRTPGCDGGVVDAVGVD